MASFAFEQLVPPEPAAGGALAIEAAPDPVAEALAEAEEIRERARAEGFAAGEQAALAAAAVRVDPLVEALSAVLAEARELAAGAADRAERAAVELALALAEKIVAGALEVQPERVIDAARGALRGIVERERVTILVSPDDLDLVREAVPELAASLGGIEHCDVQADRRLPRGGAIVRTATGEIDATAAAKLERAREAIVAELAG